MNGYFFGIITDAACCNRTPISDRVGGSAEDVERSLRYFAASGNITRLCSWAAVARTYTNPGGLQGYYHTRDARLAARDYVVQALCAEFPMLLRPMPGAPNGCRFVRGGAAQRSISNGCPSSAPEEQGEQEQGDVDDSTAGDDAETSTTAESSQAIVEDASDGAGGLPQPRSSERCACDVCGKTYARLADLKHHVSITHSDAPPMSHTCERCGKAFRKEKHRRVHMQMRRCFSRRGRVWEQSPPLQSEAA